MAAEENKTLVRGAVGVLNEGDLDAYIGGYDEDVLLHGYPPGLAPGIEGARQFYTGLATAFPDVEVEIGDLVAEGDKVTVRFTLRGTHQGEFAGVPATGNPVAVGGLTILRFADGKIAERWQVLDELGLMQQLGAIPAPETASA